MNHATVSTIAADLGNYCHLPSARHGRLFARRVAAAGGKPDASCRSTSRAKSIDVLKIVPSHLAALQTGQKPAGA